MQGRFSTLLGSTSLAHAKPRQVGSDGSCLCNAWAAPLRIVRAAFVRSGRGAPAELLPLSLPPPPPLSPYGRCTSGCRKRHGQAQSTALTAPRTKAVLRCSGALSAGPAYAEPRYAGITPYGDVNVPRSSSSSSSRRTRAGSSLTCQISTRNNAESRQQTADSPERSPSGQGLATRCCLGRASGAALLLENAHYGAETLQRRNSLNDQDASALDYAMG